MDPGTITIASFQVTRPTEVGAPQSQVIGTVTYNGTTASFIPLNNFAYGTIYTATITTGAKDLAGNAIINDYTWSFKTGDEPDITPPQVTSVTPANNAEAIAINSAITATFSEPMDISTINTSSFHVTRPTEVDTPQSPITGTVTYSGTTAIFTPSINLAYGTIYTATITTGAKDLAGNAIINDYTWSFKTGNEIDLTPPQIISTNPLNNSIDISLNSAITVIFNEPIDPGSITSSTFTLTGASGQISGTVTYSGTTATFTPSANLEHSSVYTVIITGAKDLAGNALVENYIFIFKTKSASVVSGGTKKGPCVITNTLKNTSHPEIINYLNNVKDKYIIKTEFGRWLIDLYYKLK